MRIHALLILTDRIKTGDNTALALPLFKVCIKHPVWETLTANADAFQDTITAELMQDKESIHFTYGGKTKQNFSLGLNLHFTVGNEK